MSLTNRPLQRLHDRVLAEFSRFKRRRRFIGRLPLAVILFVLLTTSATFLTFVSTTREQDALTEARTKGREQRVVQQALLDLETGARGFSLTERLDYLYPYISALQVLDDNAAKLASMDQQAQQESPTGGAKAISSLVSELRASLAVLVGRSQAAADPAQRLAALDRAKAAMDGLRSYLALSMAERAVLTAQIEGRLSYLQQLALVLQLIGGVITLGALIIAFRSSNREAAGRAEAVTAAVAARRQVEHLFAMTDILQSAAGYGDANAVLVSTAQHLLPGFGGTLYIFNNSRDRLDLSVTWSGSSENTPEAPPSIVPDECWAMKRGKPHISEAGRHALRCEHATAESAFLEIPMQARGEVYGLLQIIADGDTPTRSLAEITPLAVALADGMSLALSSMALRERLRNQALRDPLTGLHNRRFMEEVLERFVLQAERRGSPIAAIMIDLDHFKRLNDQHGHATGDAVLRDVSEALLGSLRRTDVACRYGGEELLVLLPDADLGAAVAKAEIIRQRIAELSTEHGFPVSASLGVASIPETSFQSVDLLKAADAALYAAKHSGRDKVIAAPLREPIRPVVVDRQNVRTN